MSMTLEEIAEILDRHDLKYEIRDNQIITGMETENYRNMRGDNGLLIVIKLDEDGEYINIFAPMAFRVDGEHVDAFLRACMIIQWRTKLIQFEYDENDGEIRPIVEFPLEDGKMTDRQLLRSLSGLASLVDEFTPVLERAKDEGVVEFPDSSESDTILLMMLLMKKAEGKELTPEEKRKLNELLSKAAMEDDDEGPLEL